MGSLDPVFFLTPGALGAAVEVTVANIASPTELNSRAAAQGDIVLARTVEAGTGTQTWYYADATSDAESLPYIVSSATAGVKFIAFGGRFTNEALGIGSSAASTTTATGALIVAGGSGFGGAVNAGGDVVAYKAATTRTLLSQKNSTTTTTIGDKDCRLVLQIDTGTLNAGGDVVWVSTSDTGIDRWAAITAAIASNSASGSTGSLSLCTKANDADATLTPRLTVSAAGIVTVSDTTDSSSKDTGSIVTEGGIGAEKQIFSGTKIIAATRVYAVAEAFSTYGIESTNGGGFSYTTTNQNGVYTVDYRRIASTSASGAHNARSLSGSQYGTISSGQTNSGTWSGLWSECLRNYVAASDAGTLTALEGARITVGHFSTDASTPTTTTVKGLYMPLYRSTGAIGTLYGIHIDNGSTSITPTTGYGIKIENTTGATAYAIHTGTGLVSFGDEVLTVASSTTRAGLNIPHGSAPASPVNGDIWTTTAGLFVRINGATIGPLS